MYSVATLEKLADTIAEALCCVECGVRDVAHVVRFEGLRVAYFGWCDGCFEALGGAEGYQSLLVEVLRQRQVARNN